LGIIALGSVPPIDRFTTAGDTHQHVESS